MTLGWEEQYESVKKKVAGGLAAMKKLKGILPKSMLFQVYKALVESHLREMFQFDRLVLMYKIINKICPESLRDKFAERSSISKYDTRNKTDLQVPRRNLDFSTKVSIILV